MKDIGELVIGGSRYCFSFASVIVPSGKKYFVSAYRQGCYLGSFEILQDPLKNWRIVPPAPEWAIENERMISHLIKTS